MSINDIIICILAGIGLLLVALFIVFLFGYILGKMDQLK